MAFLSLSEMMEKRNTQYYKSAKTKIHDDFLTYAQSKGGMLPRACAADFYARNLHDKEEGRTLRVLEIGVGAGNFALGFLGEVQRRDHRNKTDISERIAYTLADFSENMLANAEKKLSGAGFPNVETQIFDAAKAQIPDGISDSEFSQIYCNELFSDLPADVFVREGEKIYEVKYNDKMEDQEAQGVLNDVLGMALLNSLPKDYYLPINSIAAKSANAIAGLLSERGAFDIFDYGFYSAEYFAIPPHMWNKGVVREYGTQWTVDLNFIYMSASLNSQGFKASVEPQKDFAEKAFGEKLSLSEGPKGLDYSKKSGGIEEDDSFYHMRVVK